MATTDSTIAWEVELDRLELDLLRVERLIHTMRPVEWSPWVMPTLDVPLPQHLRARATNLHERQREAQALILRSLTQAHGQQRYAEDAAAQDELVPLYLDVTA